MKINFGQIKCPNCGSKSKILGASTMTLMYAPDYYDEDGVFHEGADPNMTNQKFICRECGEVYSISFKQSDLI